jgi:hypothetical protein
MFHLLRNCSAFELEQLDPLSGPTVDLQRQREVYLLEEVPAEYTTRDGRKIFIT